MRAMMERLAVHHGVWPFQRQRGQTAHRFYFDNPNFGCHDASIYFSMLLESRPRRVVEIGSGFSSCLLLDTNEQFFNGAIDVTLIDPSFEILTGLVGPERLMGANLLKCRVQDAPLDIFTKLEANDILFIDSSHVCKTGSDVNYYLFEILPRLRCDVLVHVHDILYPFEYPAGWVLDDNRSWNEAYAIRAFLLYNDRFDITYWNNFAYHYLADPLRRLLPLCMENEGGSLWLRKSADPPSV
jgi:hypothetical protein